MNKKISLYFIISTILILGAMAYTVYNANHEKNSLQLIVTVINHGDPKIKNAHLTGYLPYQDEISKSKSFTLGKGDSHKVYLEYDIEKMKPDYYPVVLFIDGDKGIREKRHSWVYIG